MNVVAARDDGALLVSAGGEAAAIVSDDGIYVTTRRAALARGDWTAETRDLTMDSEQRQALTERLAELDRELALVPDVFDALVADVPVLTAAAEEHTGAMIALVPTEEDAKRLAVDGGELADELHVTLGYLGEAALIPEEVQDDLIECVARCVLDRPTIVGDAFAVALFNPETGMTASTAGPLDEVDDLVASGGEPCVTLLMSGQQLPGFHEYVMRSAAQVFAQAGMEMHPQHKPWVAHLTLVYTGDADLSYFTDRVGPVTFDRVRLAFGGDVYDIPLGDTDAVTAAGEGWEAQPRDDHGRWSRTTVGGSDVDDFAKRFKKARTGRSAFRAAPSVKDLARGDQQLLDAARGYTENYQNLNNRLRSGQPFVSARDRQVHDGLQELLANARTTDDIVVTRGIGDAAKMLGPEFHRGTRIGLTWRDDAFVSTTVSDKVAKHFVERAYSNEPAIVNILVPKGTRALDMRGDDFNEKEILIGPGYRYRIVRGKRLETRPGERDPRWEFDVEIVSDDQSLTAAADVDDDDTDDGWNLPPLPNSNVGRFIDTGPPVQILVDPDDETDGEE